MFDEPDGERSLQTERLMCNTPFSRDAQDFPVGGRAVGQFVGRKRNSSSQLFKSLFTVKIFTNSRPPIFKSAGLRYENPRRLTAPRVLIF